MTNKELIQLIEECFIDVTDAGFKLGITAGVRRKFKNGNLGDDIFESKEALKNAFTSATHYHPAFRLFISLGEQPLSHRYVNNEYVENKSAIAKFKKFADVTIPMLDYSLEKLILSTGYTIVSPNTKPYIKLEQKKNRNYILTVKLSFVNYNELYEYLPIVIESRLVTKKK